MTEERLTSIRGIVHLIKQAQKKKYDSTICLSGFVGEGKSTFALQLGKVYYNVRGVNTFKRLCEKYLIYDRKSLKDLSLREKEKCLIADEAINILFKRDFMKGEQKNLLRVLDVCRDHRHFFIFNIPSFWALDQHTIQTRIRLWIHIEKQKYAHIFRPVRNPFSSDVWLRRYNEQLYTKYGGFTRSPNYVTTITFEPLSDEEYKIYESIKHRKRLEGIKDEEEVQITKKDVILWLSKNTGMTMKDIAKVVNSHYAYVQRVISANKTSS